MNTSVLSNSEMLADPDNFWTANSFQISACGSKCDASGKRAAHTRLRGFLEQRGHQGWILAAARPLSGAAVVGSLQHSSVFDQAVHLAAHIITPHSKGETQLLAASHDFRSFLIR